MILRRALERQHVLVRELHHRTRNLLGVVSIAHQTLSRSADISEFGSRFYSRVEALARVQSLSRAPTRRKLGYVSSSRPKCMRTSRGRSAHRDRGR
jgi:two-component sensor histidine kinase